MLLEVIRPPSFSACLRRASDHPCPRVVILSGMGSATDCDRRSTRPTQQGPLAALIEFRAGFHRCLAGRADAAFELTTAALCAPAPVSSVPLLSLVPVFRRSHGSLYKALDRGRVNVDVTCWPRTGQRTGRWCSPWTPRPARVATPKPRPSAGSTIRRPHIRPASRPRPAGELLGHRHRQLGEHLRHRPRSQPALAWVIPSEVGDVYTPLTPESARTPRSSPTPNATSGNTIRWRRTPPQPSCLWPSRPSRPSRPGVGGAPTHGH